MEDLQLYIRLLLGAVFLTAAVGKFLDIEGSKKAAMEFGAPESLAPTIAFGLPVVEIAIGIMLLSVNYAGIGAVGAIILLAVFTVLMGFQKIKGKAPDCHCFGAVGSEPVSGVTIARNIGLILMAIVVVFGGGANQGGSILDREISLALALTASAALPVFLMALLSKTRALKNSLAEMEARLETFEEVLAGGKDIDLEGIGHPEDGIPVGAPVPFFMAMSAQSGEQVEVSARIRSGNHVLVFVGPDCGPCGSMLPDLISLRDEFAGRLNVLLVSEGDRERNIAKFESFGIQNLFIQEAKKISSLFLAKWTPMAVLISNGRVASAVSAGELNIRRLFESQIGKGFDGETLMAGIGIPRSRYKIGETLPDFHTFSVEGDSIKGSDFSGRGGIVIFTNDSCPHCDKVADSIVELRGAGNFGERKILFLNSGDPSKLLAKGLGDCTATDDNHMLGKRMGAFGAPSAVLVDPEGKISSETAVGSVAIKALLGIYAGVDGR